MKIHIMPNELVRGIAQCQKAISNRTTMPILQCIRFEAKNNTLLLTATDLELTIQTSLFCEVLEEGVAVIPSTIIGNFYRKLPAVLSTMEVNQGVMNIRCGEIFFELQVPDANDFPDMPMIESDAVTHMPNDVFKKSVTETEFATSIDESQIALSGIYYERSPGMVRLVTLDGYRIAVKNIPLAREEADREESMIIPKRAMTEFSRMLDEQGSLTIRTDAKNVLFESDSLRLYSRLIDKKFINYEEIISPESTTRVVIDRQAMRDGIERASLVSQGDRAHLIRLEFSADLLHIESYSEIGKVNEYVDIERTGDTVSIGFNAKYLLDGLRALDSEKIALYLNGTLNPMLIRPLEDEESYLYLVLPVRIAGES